MIFSQPKEVNMIVSDKLRDGKQMHSFIVKSIIQFKGGPFISFKLFSIDYFEHM
jgi:hypothetical protein